VLAASDSEWSGCSGVGVEGGVSMEVMHKNPRMGSLQENGNVILLGKNTKAREKGTSC
jgi:hypothetical protein